MNDSLRLQRIDRGLLTFDKHNAINLRIIGVLTNNLCVVFYSDSRTL